MPQVLVLSPVVLRAVLFVVSPFFTGFYSSSHGAWPAGKCHLNLSVRRWVVTCSVSWFHFSVQRCFGSSRFCVCP